MLASYMLIPVARLGETGMAQTQTAAAADLIIEEVSHSRECLLDELARSCAGLTWNQVFIIVDRLSRTGQLLLMRKGPGVYVVRLLDK
jgi:hypothetical protein